MPTTPVLLADHNELDAFNFPANRQQRGRKAHRRLLRSGFGARLAGTRAGSLGAHANPCAAVILGRLPSIEAQSDDL